MGILFMMPQMKSATEVWLQRMIEVLSDAISVILVNDLHDNNSWRGNIPVSPLRIQEKEIRYLSTLLRGKFNGKSASMKPIDGLRKMIVKNPNSTVLCQYGTYAASFIDVWRENNNPLFVHFHGYDVFFDLKHPNDPQMDIHERDYRKKILELEHRATFIAGSQFLKSMLVQGGVSQQNVHVKYYGVPLPVAEHIHERKKDVEILHLGRLVDFKSPDRTIQAFEIAKSKGLDGRLVIVGDGPLKTTCELLRLRSPYKESISILDPVDNEIAQKMYYQSDIFTQHNITGEITGQAEGFGVSIVEAMAAGLPVVGTRSGGVVETVVDGATGCLLEPGDVEGQAAAFLELAKNPELRQQMGAAGRKRVAACFSPDQEREQLQRIMNLAEPQQ